MVQQIGIVFMEVMMAGSSTVNGTLVMIDG